MDPDFMAQQLIADHNQAMLSGATVQRVDIRHLLIPLLPFHEQKAVGDIIRRFVQFTDQAQAALGSAEAYMSAMRNALASGSFKISGRL